MLPSPSQISELINTVQSKRSPFELIYQSQNRWPLTRASKLYPPRPDDNNTQRRDTYKSPRTLRISVLDSSFNPPTRAHLALAQSKPPSRLKPTVTGTSGVPAPFIDIRRFRGTETAIDRDEGKVNKNGDSDEDYDARLLLLSIRNADKILKTSDASYSQRLEMMYLLAHEVGRRGTGDVSSGGSIQGDSSSDDGSVAIGIIDEPTFVRKADVLHTYLKSRVSDLHQNESNGADPVHIQLSFLMGYDTLERLFAPRYYQSIIPLSVNSEGNSSTETPANTQQLSQEEVMHTALRAFFFEKYEDFDGIKTRNKCSVICAYRDPRSWMKSTQEGDGADQTTDKQMAFLQRLQPYIDAGCVSFLDLSPEEASMSSSEVRKQVKEEIESGGKANTQTVEWRKLVCEDIARYIENSGLFKSV